MLNSGWVEEVERLLTAGIAPSSPAFQAIGYPQLARYLRGESSLDEAVEATVRATRRFAKRQLTWFRREPEIHWLRADNPEALEHRAIEVIRSDGVGGGNA